MPSDLRRDQSERDQDKTLEDTFPASDPPANSGITGAEPPANAPEERGLDERPIGGPTSDRHAVETAHQWEHEEKASDQKGG